MGVSKNRGIPKWMVKIMENPIKMDDLWGKPIIFGNIHINIKIILPEFYCCWKKSAITTWDVFETPVDKGISTTVTSTGDSRISSTNSRIHKHGILCPCMPLKKQQKHSCK